MPYSTTHQGACPPIGGQRDLKSRLTVLARRLTRSLSPNTQQRLLSDFDDHMLRDIGITRAEAEGIDQNYLSGFEALENWRK